MAKVLLHIGYPKTGTTTLQNSFFRNLFEKNMINFIGRGSSNRKSHLLNDYMYGISKNIPFDIIDETKINVISDEDYTVSDFFLKYIKKTTNLLHYEERMNRLSNLIENHDVTVLCCLRNQPDLLFSWYVQMNRFLCISGEINRFEDMYNNNNPALKQELCTPYYFNHILKGWKRRYWS